MKNQTCILCGLPLSVAKTNKEHFIPATVLRSLTKLGIPESWTHARRTNRYEAFSVGRVLPIAQHKEWATVEVHERCNLDASPMCQDLKRFIDHPEEATRANTARIRQYYARLWRYEDPDDMSVSFRSHVPKLSNLVYRPGYLRLGSLGIWAHHGRDLAEMGVDGHYHTIHLGTKAELEKLAR